MRPPADLPEPVLRHILTVARGRLLAGNNGYAIVSRDWLHASSSSEEEEPLLLVLNLNQMSSQQVNRAANWATVHGQHVHVLVVEGSGLPVQRLDWFSSAAPALTRLRRLEVDQADSLWRLAPVLGQLPQLQQLSAAVTVRYQETDPPYIVDETGWACPSGPGVGENIFVEAPWNPHEGPCHWCELPDMQQLCPKLTYLHLTLDMRNTLDTNLVDQRLPQLLPAHLQQLTLAAADSKYCGMVPACCLTHLTALRVLALGLFEVWGAELVGLGALQQVRVVVPPLTQIGMDALVPLAPMVIEIQAPSHSVAELAPFQDLTRLVLLERVPEGTAEAIAELTGLQELGLPVLGSSTAAVVQQVAGMAQLRSLQLEGVAPHRPATLCAALAQCTQLTSLMLDLDKEGAAGVRPWLAALQQLTGLRRLSVPTTLLSRRRGSWLAVLRQLTHLRLRVWQQDFNKWQLPPRSPDLEVRSWAPGVIEQALLQQVPEWPATLQQVEVWVPVHLLQVKPAGWQFTAARPAGLQFSVWLEQQDSGTARGWERPFRPCPHLPGVWELQGQVEGGQ